MPDISISYSFPYFFITAVFFILAVMEELSKNKNIFFYFSFFVALIFIGFRGYVFTDWIVYSSYFQEIPTLFHFSFKGNVYDYEILFYIYASIIKTIVPNYHFFIFVDSCVNLLLFSVFLKQYSTNKSLSILIFLVMGGLSFFFNLLRNSKSIFIFMISLKHIINKKFWKFTIINIIGSLFHVTAILFIPMYFIAKMKPKRILIFFIMVLGIVFYILKIDIFRSMISLMGKLIGGKLGDLVAIYLDNAMYSKAQTISVGFLEKLITMIAILLLYDRLIKVRKEGFLFINIFIVYFIIYFYFSSIRIIPERVGILYVFPYTIIWIDILLIFIRKDKFLLMLFLFGFFLLKISNYNTIIMRYDNILFEYQSIDQRKYVFDKSRHLIE